MKSEYRCLDHAEVRAAGDGRSVQGYGAVFNSWSEDLGGFREIIRPGAFKRAVTEKQDVRLLVNHEPGNVLGRTLSNTLTLREDARGLYFSCELPDTSVARDLRQSMQRGDVDQCSFGFFAKRDKWLGQGQRELLDVDLFEVSIVTFPAYAATSAAVRAKGNGVLPPMGAYSGRTPALEEVSDEERERLRLKLQLARLL